ncbi:hypothetical protein [Metabacillus schmidteae]|uniref:hypothetical protein n=1 Tax=Metabacillus schmidteae TaxID=2730405 RepID=UPI0015884A37|nr:hypothetical protein [Metabacillus schmidteae]
MNSNNEIKLKQLKENYENALKELSEFIESGKTYKDMTIPDFKEQVRLFWERSDLWKQALEQGIYSKEKLDEDFKLLKMHAKRLLL